MRVPVRKFAGQPFLAADTVAAILVHLPAGSFKATPTELHAGFRRAADGFPELLGQISFGKVGSYCHSPTIAAALESLAASSYWSRGGRDLLKCRLDRDRLREYYDRGLNWRFSEAGISVETIDRASRMLLDALSELRLHSNHRHLMVTE